MLNPLLTLYRLPVLLGLLLLLAATGCTASAKQVTNESGSAERVEKRLGTQYEDIILTKVAGPLENPWSVALMPDGRMLVTERSGRLQLVNGADLTEIGGVPEVAARGQGGLLDVVLHPRYADNGWIYLTYSKPSPDGDTTATALVRARIDEAAMTLTDVEELFVQNRFSQPGRHYGSRLAWMLDGTLLMSIGDRGNEPPRAQDLSDHAGTVLRMNDDGSVPGDNPFLDNPDALDEIYSYGNRNIQGLVVDPDSGRIWATEHGPRGGDEINLIQPGHNYGWPVVTLGLNYRDQGPFPDAEARSKDGMTDPFYEFLPTHAPSGLALVTHERFSAWKGDLLAGGLRSERIRRVVFDEQEVLHEEELLLQEVGRIRDVREGPDGAIWVLTDASEGYLYRMQPAE